MCEHKSWSKKPIPTSLGQTIDPNLLNAHFSPSGPKCHINKGFRKKNSIRCLPAEFAKVYAHCWLITSPFIHELGFGRYTIQLSCQNVLIAKTMQVLLVTSSIRANLHGNYVRFYKHSPLCAGLPKENL